MKNWMDSTAIAVVGERGSGKTAACCSFLDGEKNRPVYVFAHPKPWLVKDRGWINMRRLEELNDIDNAVVWIDEPQIAIPKLDKRANDGLQRLLSIARHRDLTLMISTCDTRWITRALESYINVWIIKDIEPRLVKQGALIKKIIQRYVVIDPDEFQLEPNEYLFYCRQFPDMDDKFTFELPKWFDEEWSKAYSLANLRPEVRRVS